MLLLTFNMVLSIMPTILKLDGYRFFFFSLEGNEPPHIHVEHGNKVAKYWLNPLNLANSAGFKNHELTKVKAIIIEYRIIFLEKWHEYFGNQI
jgi:hypothetical protein